MTICISPGSDRPSQGWRHGVWPAKNRTKAIDTAIEAGMAAGSANHGVVPSCPLPEGFTRRAKSAAICCCVFLISTIAVRTSAPKARKSALMRSCFKAISTRLRRIASKPSSAMGYRLSRPHSGSRLALALTLCGRRRRDCWRSLIIFGERIQTDG